MKVLSLLASLDPARGGTQSAAANILVSTQRLGVCNVVAAPEGRAGRDRARSVAEALGREGVRAESFSSLRWPPRAGERWGISPGQALWTGMHVRDFDVVHIHGIWGAALVSGLLAASAARVPVVVTAHESLTAFDVDNSRSETRRRQKLAVKRLYVRLTRLFLLTSQLETRESLVQVPPDRLSTIHYPVFDDRLPLPAPKPVGRRPELRVGFLGRIDRKKNLPLLIEALADLPAHVRLMVAGDGEDEYVRPARQHADQLGVNHRVDWLGFVSRDERAAYLDELDVLAMPSRFESFGMSAAEAMLQGRPTIVSDRTGIAEVISRRGGGIVVAPTRVELAAAIRRCDADRAGLAALAGEAQGAVRSELSFTEIGTAFKKAYKTAAGASPRR